VYQGGPRTCVPSNPTKKIEAFRWNSTLLDQKSIKKRNQTGSLLSLAEANLY
jgi:hypothetical protein